MDQNGRFSLYASKCKSLLAIYVGINRRKEKHTSERSKRGLVQSSRMSTYMYIAFDAIRDIIMNTEASVFLYYAMSLLLNVSPHLCEKRKTHLCVNTRFALINDISAFSFTSFFEVSKCVFRWLRLLWATLIDGSCKWTLSCHGQHTQTFLSTSKSAGPLTGSKRL